MNIGLVGLGLLGSALADRLSASGFSVAGYDLRAERRTVDSLQAVTAASQRIVLSLPDSNIVATVVDEIGPFLFEGAILIDTTYDYRGRKKTVTKPYFPDWALK